MKINDFTEKQIREAIIGKIKPLVPTGCKHQKGVVYLEGMAVATITIPNSHKRVMHHNKSKHIAAALKLECREFNDLVKCTLTGPKYYKILKTKIANE
jgi:hypothetical protein